jgi:hypothetical protein
LLWNKPLLNPVAGTTILFIYLCHWGLTQGLMLARQVRYLEPLCQQSFSSGKHILQACFVPASELMELSLLEGPRT